MHLCKDKGHFYMEIYVNITSVHLNQVNTVLNIEHYTNKFTYQNCCNIYLPQATDFSILALHSFIIWNEIENYAYFTRKHVRHLSTEIIELYNIRETIMNYYFKSFLYKRLQK